MLSHLFIPVSHLQQLRRCKPDIPKAASGHASLAAAPAECMLAADTLLQVRCLVDVPGVKLPSDLPEYLRRQVAPQVPEDLRPAFLEAIDQEAIRSMQNKQVSCQPLHMPGKALQCQQAAAVDVFSPIISC